MIRFQNGDVMLSADEYQSLINAHHSTIRDLGKLVNRLSKFCYNLKDQYLEFGMTAANFNPNKLPPVSEQHYRISERDYKLFRVWNKLINEFNPNRPDEDEII